MSQMVTWVQDAPGREEPRPRPSPQQEQSGENATSLVSTGESSPPSPLGALLAPGGQTQDAQHLPASCVHTLFLHLCPRGTSAGVCSVLVKMQTSSGHEDT